MKLKIAPMPSTKFQFSQTNGLGDVFEKLNKNGCHGGHLEYLNRTILAILKMVTSPPPHASLKVKSSIGHMAPKDMALKDMLF